jgi:glycosyltransferase involved in cell wall biosynthesis
MTAPSRSLLTRTRSGRHPGKKRSDPAELVSICIPTWNAGESIAAAVESALNQDYSNLEVVVSDDASEDDTVDFLKRRFGDRIRLVVNRKRRGLAANSNVSIAHSTGSFVKFLHQDDQLDRNCVSSLVASLVAHPSAGMAFSRRRVAVDEDTPATRDWIQQYGDLQSGFRSLRTLSRGSDLIEELLEHGLRNWIGEPVCVMVRRATLAKVGGFHRRVSQLVDLELWLRVMARSDVVFLDEELVTFRHSSDSLTQRVLSARLEWLDRLWMLETLVEDPTLRARIPGLEERWRLELRGARRALLGWRPWRNDPPIRPWIGYSAHRLLRPLGLSHVVGSI